MILQFYIWRNVAFSTEEDDDVFEFDADEVENSTKERQGELFQKFLVVKLCECF